MRSITIFGVFPVFAVGFSSLHGFYTWFFPFICTGMGLSVSFTSEFTFPLSVPKSVFSMTEHTALSPEQDDNESKNKQNN